MSKVMLKEQEVSGQYKLDGQIYATRGFMSAFGDYAPLVIWETMHLIQLRVSEGADYFQSAEYEGIRFWIIDDVKHITFLLPEEY